MPTPTPNFRTYSTAVVLLLACCAVVAAHNGILILMAAQPNAPVRLASTTTGGGALLHDAELRNDGVKEVVSYRLGWAYVRPNNEIEFHTGASTRITLGRGIFRKISGENVPFDTRAQYVIFFVAEVAFADETYWKADYADIRREIRDRTK